MKLGRSQAWIRESAPPLHCYVYDQSFFQLVILYYKSFNFPYVLNQALYREKKSEILNAL